MSGVERNENQYSYSMTGCSMGQGLIDGVMGWLACWLLTMKAPLRYSINKLVDDCEIS